MVPIKNIIETLKECNLNKSNKYCGKCPFQDQNPTSIDTCVNELHRIARHCLKDELDLIEYLTKNPEYARRYTDFTNYNK